MALLESLGVNGSALIQFVIFSFAIIFLSIYVFKPYLAAYDQRKHQTKGGEELASEIQGQAAELKLQYEQKARKVNQEIKTIFDQHREEANKEYQKIVSLARSESGHTIESARARVTKEINQAAQQLKTEVTNVAATIVKKVLT